MPACTCSYDSAQGFIWAKNLGGGGGGNRGGRGGVIIVKQELCVFNCLISLNFLGGNKTSCGGNTPCWPLCR